MTISLFALGLYLFFLPLIHARSRKYILALLVAAAIYEIIRSIYSIYIFSL